MELYELLIQLFQVIVAALTAYLVKRSNLATKKRLKHNDKNVKKFVNSILPFFETERELNQSRSTFKEEKAEEKKTHENKNEQNKVRVLRRLRVDNVHYAVENLTKLKEKETDTENEDDSDTSDSEIKNPLR